ncbi:MAG: NAD(+)/NADH kinase [Clostridia bacterium]|nr:NAD(+)/NADH kinase [Clostridia bacterium]
MLQFALITNFNINEKLSAAIRVADKLIEAGECRILITVNNKDRITRMHQSRKQFTYLPADQVYSEADVIVVLGGDGTILESARRAAPHGTPIIGINLGRLGYMAELDMTELDLLPKLFSGEYNLEKRSMLSVSIIGSTGKIRFNSYALNEAVISNGSIARIVDLELYEEDTFLNSYRADGLIIATPTGSTAYSMSAGGPIIDPALACFCVTPICSHFSSSRPVLFSNRSVLCVKNVCKREKSLYLTLDGKSNSEIYYGDFVKITRSDLTTKLIRIKKQMFYKTLRQKMNEYNN